MRKTDQGRQDAKEHAFVFLASWRLGVLGATNGSKNSDCPDSQSWTLFTLSFIVIAAGCCHNPPSSQAIYNGPTQTMAQVVAEINDNNRKIPSLWSTLYYKANIVDDKKHGHFINGEGHLLYRQPGDLRLIGTKEAIGPDLRHRKQSRKLLAARRAGTEHDVVWPA